MRPKYISNLVNEGTLNTNEGKKISIWRLNECNDEEILSEWAEHIRHHYCSDYEMDFFRKHYNYTRKEFLELIKLPNPSEKLGCAIMSGDFCEILVADYAQFILSYYVPRTRYDKKVNPNSSTQGSDVVCFKVGKTVSRSDELLIFEVKAQATNGTAKEILQKAVNDSSKDIKRIGFSLNAINQRLCEKQLFDEAKIVQRFQNAIDRPYKSGYGAAAVHSESSFSPAILQDVTTAMHFDPNLQLLVIHSKDLMNFIHELYRRASVC